ncbi:MAG: hypothetical protein EP303_07900, partial [Deltaproteobacteria bacterium]
MILPSWFPSRSDTESGVRLLTKAPGSDEDAAAPAVATTPDAEWLTTNAGGSFAMGTIDRCPRRKYHSLLTIREPGVGEPLNMVAEVEEWFHVGDERVALHSYNWGNTIEPNGVDYLSRFEPLPRWTYEFSGLTVTREVWLEDHADAVWIRYSIEGLTKPVDLRLRPLIRCRPIHELTVANPFMNGEIDVERAESLRVVMHPYKDVPALITSLHGASGTFHADGHWYEGVHYEWERERGYDDAEDLFTPGEFRLGIEHDGAFSIRLGTSSAPSHEAQVLSSVLGSRRSFVQELDDAAEAYLVELGGERTGVIAGYPWFGEWSRDSLIALPGLCLARDQVDDALGILESLADRLENGLVPNIPQSGDVPSNAESIDASLLFIRATALTAKRTRSRRIKALQEGPDRPNRRRRGPTRAGRRPGFLVRRSRPLGAHLDGRTGGRLGGDTASRLRHRPQRAVAIRPRDHPSVGQEASAGVHRKVERNGEETVRSLRRKVLASRSGLLDRHPRWTQPRRTAATQPALGAGNARHTDRQSAQEAGACSGARQASHAGWAAHALTRRPGVPRVLPWRAGRAGP